MDKWFRDCLALEQVRVSLAGQIAVQTLLKQSIDAILNEAIEVWSGTIHADNDDYAVWMSEFHGIFWAKAVDDFGPVGYFTNKQSVTWFTRSGHLVNGKSLTTVHDDQKTTLFG